MQTALERGATALPATAEPPARASRTAVALLAAAAVLLFAAAFFGGGPGGGQLVWIGLGCIVVALGAGTVALAGLVPLPAPGRPAGAAVALLFGFVFWTGASVEWTIVGDRSWSYANRGFVYGCFCLLGLFVGALLPRAPQVVATGLAALLGLVLGWALLGKVIPSLFPDGARVARLRSPVGYWNALALLADMALPLALWIAARRRNPDSLRAAATLLLYLSAVALVLTYSRAGIVIGALAVIAWLALVRARLESFGALVVVLPVALGVVGFAFTRPGVVDDLQSYSRRVNDGAWFGCVLFAGACVVVATTLWLLRRARERPLSDVRRTAWTRRVGALLGAVLVVAVVAFAFRGGGPSAWLHEFRNPASVQVTEGPGRLGESSSNNRWTWWREAWRVFQDHVATGTGAGTFEVARTRVREDALVVSEPHGLPLQFLSETGIVGFLLWAGAVVLAVVGVVGSIRRSGGGQRAPAVALAIGAGAYLLHALVDIDWDFLAVSAPAFFVLGVLLASGRAVRARGRTRFAAPAVAALAVVAAGSLLAPWLSNRRVNAAYDALDRGRYAQAAADARSAHRWNPLSIEPLDAWALAETSRGDRAKALDLYKRAAVLQHENSIVWYDLGSYEFLLGNYQAAYKYLDISYGLDHYGYAGRPGSLLDQVRPKLGR